MSYCATCSTSLMERTLFGSKLLLCPLCGDVYEQVHGTQYRYLGTTHGNRVMRELLPLTDEHKEVIRK